jgi:hypothetical protein
MISRLAILMLLASLLMIDAAPNRKSSLLPLRQTVKREISAYGLEIRTVAFSS